jgi:hypothetical protein
MRRRGQDDGCRQTRPRVRPARCSRGRARTVWRRSAWPSATLSMRTRLQRLNTGWIPFVSAADSLRSRTSRTGRCVCVCVCARARVRAHSRFHAVLTPGSTWCVCACACLSLCVSVCFCVCSCVCPCIRVCIAAFVSLLERVHKHGAHPQLIPPACRPGSCRDRDPRAARDPRALPPTRVPRARGSVGAVCVHAAAQAYKHSLLAACLAAAAAARRSASARNARPQEAAGGAIPLSDLARRRQVQGGATSGDFDAAQLSVGDRHSQGAQLGHGATGRRDFVRARPCGRFSQPSCLQGRWRALAATSHGTTGSRQGRRRRGRTGSSAEGGRGGRRERCSGYVETGGQARGRESGV